MIVTRDQVQERVGADLKDRERIRFADVAASVEATIAGYLRPVYPWPWPGDLPANLVSAAIWLIADELYEPGSRRRDEFAERAEAARRLLESIRKKHIILEHTPTTESNRGRAAVVAAAPLLRADLLSRMPKP